MAELRAQVILHTVNNLAADYVTNSWAVSPAGTVADADIQEYTDAFKDFYDDLSGILGEPIAQNGHQIKWYDLMTPVPPNYPLTTDTFNLASAPTGNPLPSEVAICLSFQGARVSGFPQRRRRGRIYIGPLNQNINSAGRPSSGAISTIASAAATLTSNLKACSVPGTLGVWSHVDSLLVPVEDGWVDNSFDTQRRRGIVSTSRNTWVAA